MFTEFKDKPWIHILLVAVIGLLAYANTFKSPFHFDDRSSIVDNPIIKDLRYFTEPSSAEDLRGYFENQKDFESVYTAFRWRYIGYLSFALNYRFHGLDVEGYHAVNLIIHIINALLVYFLVLLTSRTPAMNRSVYTGTGTINAIALFSALLFISHPIQTQSVTYIVQRLASLATMFYVLSIVMYVKSGLLQAGKGRPASCSAPCLIFYSLSFISAVLAMKTKEIAFTLPVVILLYDIVFFDRPLRKSIVRVAPLLLTMLVIPFSVLNFENLSGELIGSIGETVRLGTDTTRLDYLFTQFRVLLTYIRLVFLPVHQTPEYDFPLFHSLFNPEVFFSFLFLAVLFATGIYLFYRFRTSMVLTRLVSFGIIWFFIAISVESSIIPITDVIFEHRMYLPSIGLFFALSTALMMGVEKLKERWKGTFRAVVPLLAVIIAALTATTYARNEVWKDELTLMEDTARKSPELVRVHINLGAAYMSKGMPDKAREHLQTVLKLNPNFGTPYFLVGSSYHSQGILDEAEKYYLSAIKHDPSFAKVYYNLGIIYQSRRLIDRAAEHYRLAIQYNPFFTKAYYNLGSVYQSKGQLDDAITNYEYAIKLYPAYDQAYNNLGVAYQTKGQLDRAIEHFQMALKINPNHPRAGKNLQYTIMLKDSKGGRP